MTEQPSAVAVTGPSDVGEPTKVGAELHVAQEACAGVVRRAEEGAPGQRRGRAGSQPLEPGPERRGAKTATGFDSCLQEVDLIAVDQLRPQRRGVTGELTGVLQDLLAVRRGRGGITRVL